MGRKIEVRGSHSPQAEKIRLFHSWEEPQADDPVVAFPTNSNLGFATYTNEQGIFKKSFSYITFPKGFKFVSIYRRIVSQESKKGSFDFTDGRHRCRHGTENGGVHHIQFHIPKGARILLRKY